jgi:hypothetical protein
VEDVAPFGFPAAVGWSLVRDDMDLDQLLAAPRAAWNADGYAATFVSWAITTDHGLEGKSRTKPDTPMSCGHRSHPARHSPRPDQVPGVFK